MPLASAIGWFAQNPITKQAIAAETIVATKTKLKSKNPFSGPANSPESIRGFKKITYAVSKNVVRDAFNSCRMFVLSSLNLKNFSINSPLDGL